MVTSCCSSACFSCHWCNSCGAMQCNAMQCNAVQYNAMHCYKMQSESFIDPLIPYSWIYPPIRQTHQWTLQSFKHPPTYLPSIQPFLHTNRQADKLTCCCEWFSCLAASREELSWAMVAVSSTLSLWLLSNSPSIFNNSLSSWYRVRW